MHSLVAFFDCGEDCIPFAFDVGAVGVKLVLETGLSEYRLALGDILADRDAYPNWDNA